MKKHFPREIISYVGPRLRSAPTYGTWVLYSVWNNLDPVGWAEHSEAQHEKHSIDLFGWLAK